ncbi:MAG: CRISPR-associated helicase Cas3' [Sporomusaceae bacterium]|jgi:CRISPR-associated endonuclease/helicase Cas3|nr:CRISPR-associated helicase Cas3' [Sporomusaceae bacterium]
MVDVYLAKTKPQETIAAHTDNLLEQYEKLKKIYGHCQSPYLNWEVLRLACLYHDLGKMDVKFQNKLRKNLQMPLLPEGELAKFPEIRHNFLSPAFIPQEVYENLSPLEQKVLFQSIYRHHNCKRSEVDFDNYIKPYLTKIKVYAEKSGFTDSKYLQDLKIDFSLNNNYGKFIEKEDLVSKEENIWYHYVVTKGLLNKLDYAASTIIGEEPLAVEIEPINLTEKTQQFMERRGFSLNELQTYLAGCQDKNNIVVAATGFGKTEAGLMWLGENKGFFTLPLKVSINAIYDRLITKMEVPSSKVGLLHSDTFSEYVKRKLQDKDEEEQTEFDDRYLQATEQMSLPLTICTLDQLISFVFKCDGCELNLATLAYSKIIIDEIQMYAPHYLAAVIVALKYLTDVGGKFTIMTATFPPVLLDLRQHEKYKIPVTLCEKEFYQDTLRHRAEIFEKVIDLAHLKENFQDGKKYLIICNTVRKAQEIYQELKADPFFQQKTKINLLHARFCKKHRSQKESAILKMGDKENKRDFGIWVTTQIVEASLDIDFDYLYTELSEINGLFQRMGRVYRNRVLDISTPNIFVYVGTEDNLPSLVTNNIETNYGIDYNIFASSKKVLLENQINGIFDYHEKLKMEMVKKIYSTENLRQGRNNLGKNYYDQLLNALKNLTGLTPYEDKNATLKLRDIEQTQCIPLEIYEKEKNNIDHLINKLRVIFKEEKALKSSNIGGYKNCLGKNKIIKQKLLLELNEYKLPVWTNIFNGNCYESIEINKYIQIELVNFCYSDELGLIYKQFKTKETTKNTDTKFADRCF